jgi:ACS family tartrate transporter-like MFS transporter
MLFWVPTLVDAIVYGGDIDVAAGGASREAKSRARTGSKAVLLSAVPFVCAALCSVWLGRRSQARCEKALHVAVPYAACALLFFLFPIAATLSSVWGFICLTAVVTTLNGANAVLNSFASSIARGPAQPLSLALYNAVGNLGGIVGPWLIGAVVHHTGVYTAAMQVLGVLVAAAAGMVYSMRHWPQT